MTLFLFQWTRYFGSKKISQFTSPVSTARTNDGDNYASTFTQSTSDGGQAIRSRCRKVCLYGLRASATAIFKPIEPTRLKVLVVS